MKSCLGPVSITRRGTSSGEISLARVVSRAYAMGTARRRVRRLSADDLPYQTSSDDRYTHDCDLEAQLAQHGRNLAV